MVRGDGMNPFNCTVFVREDVGPFDTFLRRMTMHFAKHAGPDVKVYWSHMPRNPHFGQFRHGGYRLRFEVVKNDK
jgi:hypothetical protein